ncbi:hypothetical protein G6S60_004629 [Salmonella enterica]|nr:hypothetical protein [Salmonella enterica]
MRKIQCWYLLFLLLLLSLVFMPDHKMHTNYKYSNVNEHLDVHFKWPKVKIAHVISDKSNNIILSEEVGGFYYRNPFSGAYNIIATKHSYTLKDNDLLAALISQQDMISACIYNTDQNAIIFFDEMRGGIKISDEVVNLSSLFLGHDGEFHCINNKN